MGDARRLPFWKREWTISPARAALLGVALGAFLSIVCALSPPRDFSFGFLATMAISLVPFLGIFGYILWLCGDPARLERFQVYWGRAIGVMILGLLIAFPSAWPQVVRSPLLVVIFLGGICATAMFAVGAGWGIVHLLGHLASALHHDAKAVARLRTDGVWDSDLDQY